MGRLTPLLEFGGKVEPLGFEGCSFFKMHVCLSTRSLVSLWWIRVQCSQFGSQAAKGWKPVVNWVVPMTRRPFKEASWKDKRSGIHSFGAPKVDTLLDLPGHDMFIDPSLVTFVRMKMLNVDTAKWYQSRIWLHQTCYFLGGVYLLCLTSFTRELPRICKPPGFGQEGRYDLHILHGCHWDVTFTFQGERFGSDTIKSLGGSMAAFHHKRSRCRV